MEPSGKKRAALRSCCPAKQAHWDRGARELRVFSVCWTQLSSEEHGLDEENMDPYWKLKPPEPTPADEICFDSFDC